jgi:hypothetical protein
MRRLRRRRLIEIIILMTKLTLGLSKCGGEEF